MHPAEQLRDTRRGRDGNGFLAHGDLHITGLADPPPTADRLYPVAFLLMGHH